MYRVEGIAGGIRRKAITIRYITGGVVMAMRVILDALGSVLSWGS